VTRCYVRAASNSIGALRWLRPFRFIDLRADRNGEDREMRSNLNDILHSVIHVIYDYYAADDRRWDL